MERERKEKRKEKKRKEKKRKERGKECLNNLTNIYTASVTVKRDKSRNSSVSFPPCDLLVNSLTKFITNVNIY